MAYSPLQISKNVVWIVVKRWPTGLSELKWFLDFVQDRAIALIPDVLAGVCGETNGVRQDRRLL